MCPLVTDYYLHEVIIIILVFKIKNFKFKKGVGIDHYDKK